MKPTILVDVDGTLAIRGDRSPHDHDSSMEDHVNWPIVSLCDLLHSTGKFQVVIVSGREEIYRDITEYWFDTHNILPYRQALFMRLQGDNRPDDIVKKELYEKEIKPRYIVWYVLDDRNRVVKMWRELGLTCLQVAEGDF